MPHQIHNPIRPNFTCHAGELRRRSGFSMLEMMLVLAIVLVVAALAVPALQGTIGNQAIVSGTDRVQAAMGQARVQAIRSGDVHALFYQRNGQWFDVAPLNDHGKLTSQRSNGGQSVSIHDRELSENWLPRQVRFVAGETEINARSEAASEGSNARLDAVLFYPDGTSQDARLLLQDERGRTMAVELRGLTGMAKTIRRVGSNGQGSGAK